MQPTLENIAQVKKLPVCGLLNPVRRAYSHDGPRAARQATAPMIGTHATPRPPPSTRQKESHRTTGESHLTANRSRRLARASVSMPRCPSHQPSTIEPMKSPQLTPSRPIIVG